MTPRVALITGASQGIGAATARLLAKTGYLVAINYRSQKDAAMRVADELNAGGVKAITIQADVGRETAVLGMFETVDRELGPIHALVNNAGITGGYARVEDVSVQQIEEVFRINVTGAVLCAREAVRRMSTKRGGQGGSIVNISSIAAKLGSPGEYVHYAASKAAIDALTVGLAKEVATDGIRVNAVAPGLIETGIHAANGDPGRLERLRPTIPMQRPGTPEEVAEAVSWLLSDAASYVTGSILAIGGGR